MPKKTPINKLLQEFFGDKSSAIGRATNAIVRILEIMHPKFDEEWEEQGYEADEEGYVAQFEWSADTIDMVAQTLHTYGFGPESECRRELEMALEPDDDDDEEDED